MITKRTILPMVVILATAGRSFAQTSFPMISSTYPTGGQRGKTVDVTVSGYQNFYGATKVLFEGKGLSAEVVPPNPDPPKNDANNNTLRVTVAPDADLGVHEFRFMTPRGVSSVGLFVVGDEPELNESASNNTPAQAQEVTIPVTINGKIETGEDIDCFKFKVDAGQTLAFHVLSGRLEDKMHDLQTHVDPIISISDASDRELANNDDYFKADPYLVYKFDKAGEYFVRVRDVRYQGNSHWVYRLTITNKPYLTAIYPMGVKRGGENPVELVGTGTGGMQRTQVRIANDMPTGPQLIQVSTPNGMSNGVPVFVSDLDSVVESEPNNDFASATKIQMPCIANGRMNTDSDVDTFRFSAKKGESFSFEVMARRLDSPVDTTIAIIGADGNEVASNDDTSNNRISTADSTIPGWTAPADGEYALTVRDLHNRSGEAFVYVVICMPQEQDVEVRCDPDKAMIGPGGSYPIFVLIDRQGGFTGEVKVVVEGMPKGVTASSLTIPSQMNQGVVVLNAAADASIDATNVQILGIATVQRNGKPEEIRRVATPMEEIYFPGGGRGLYPINLTTVSVTQPQDILVEISPQQITLTPGSTATIDVTIKRTNYTKSVSVDVLLRHLGGVHANPLPPGVTIEDLKIIAENQDKTQILLKVADDAKPIENWPIAVMGQVSINFVVKTSYCAPPLMISIAPKK